MSEHEPTVVTGAEISEFVTDGDPKSVRPTSYDVRIGTILARDEKSVVEKDDMFVLRPQGVVEVISKETIELPLNMTGMVHVKTGLCDQGIMALNIGLIDPGYQGKLSTTLVNLSSRDYVLTAGEVVLRVTVFRCPAASKPYGSTSEYLTRKRQKILLFSETFLNLGPAIARETAPVFWKYAGLAGALLATIAFIVNLGLAFAGRNFWSKADIKEEVLRELQRDSAEIEKLRRQVADLQRQLATTASRTSHPDDGAGVSSAIQNNAGAKR